MVPRWHCAASSIAMSASLDESDMIDPIWCLERGWFLERRRMKEGDWGRESTKKAGGLTEFVGTGKELC